MAARPGGAVFAGPAYLGHWAAPTRFCLASRVAQPVTHVSWFAANAYCEAQGARLPPWIEWEYVAAADATRRDARRDPAVAPAHPRVVRAILVARAAARRSAAPNFYGVRDLHGVVWEWADDYSALMVSADNRNQGDPDRNGSAGPARSRSMIVRTMLF